MYENFQQPPIYELTDPYAQPIYTNQFELPYTDNTYMNQELAPVYEIAPSQPPPAYSVYTQPEPIYQTLPQQSPPSYATVTQSPPYSASVQQPQQPLNNSHSSAVPFSPGYKWPHKSVPLVCPRCGATVTTRVESKITIITIIGALLLFCFACILSCLPFCIPGCKKSTHYCPHCNNILGVRRELR